MKLTEIAAALKTKPEGQAILIYGDPKSGKTWLAATMAKVPAIRKIYYFDLARESDTILKMMQIGYFTPEEADKFEIFRIPDLPSSPRGFETVLKVLTSPKKFYICTDHGKADCLQCKTGTPFELGALDYRDVVIIDSGSQLADSIMAYYCKGRPVDYKPGWDEYGPQGRILSDLLSVIQAGQTNFIMITHVLTVEEETGEYTPKGEPITRDRYFPLIGSKNYSMRVAKFFGHVVLTNLRKKKHQAGSSTSYRSDAITGSRLGWEMEKTEKPDFNLAFQLFLKENDKALEVLRTTTANTET